MLNEESLRTFHCPRWAELPSIPLYMDQVILLLDDALRPVSDEGERCVTSTMINNYVKQKLVAPPIKKKYGRPQISGILVVSVLKRVLSMPEILGLYGRLIKEHGAEQAYELFCTEFEQAIRAAFVDRLAAPVSIEPTPKALLGAALTAWAGKVAVQQYLATSIEEPAAKTQ